MIEGGLYALFPERMKRVMAAALQIPSETLRSAGLAAAIAGVAILWLLGD